MDRILIMLEVFVGGGVAMLAVLFTVSWIQIFQRRNRTSPVLERVSQFTNEELREMLKRKRSEPME